MVGREFEMEMLWIVKLLFAKRLCCQSVKIFDRWQMYLLGA